MTTRTQVKDVTVVFAGFPVTAFPAEGIELTAVAVTGAQAVLLTRTHRPDVLIVDLRRPELDGIEVIRQVRRSVPGTAILVMVPGGDDELVIAAMRAGAMGFLHHGGTCADLLRAIRVVAAGAAVFGESVANRMMGLLSEPKPLRAFPVLTSREHEVLELLAGGLANADIARRLDVAPKTVRNHVSSILAKLGAADRARVIIKARNAGLGPLDQAD